MNPCASSSGVVCALPTTNAPARSTTNVSVIVPPASMARTRGSRAMARAYWLRLRRDGKRERAVELERQRAVRVRGAGQRERALRALVGAGAARDLARAQEDRRVGRHAARRGYCRRGALQRARLELDPVDAVDLLVGPAVDVGDGAVAELARRERPGEVRPGSVHGRHRMPVDDL